MVCQIDGTEIGILCSSYGALKNLISKLCQFLGSLYLLCIVLASAFRHVCLTQISLNEGNLFSFASILLGSDEIDST